MDQYCTPEDEDNYRCFITKEKRKLQVPGKLTMNFIMQFACVYHVEKKLPLDLSGFVLN